MEKLDGLVLTSLADKVFTPTRARAMLQGLQRDMKANRTTQDAQLKTLTKELDQVGKATERLYEAVEQGVLELNDSLKTRSHKLQARRQSILTEIAGLKTQTGMPSALLRPKHIEAFIHSLKTKLLSNRGFAKEYLKLLVDEIRVERTEVKLCGSVAALAQVAADTNLNTLAGVPRFAPKWLPERGSN
jgi:chorismate mutase